MLFEEFGTQTSAYGGDLSRHCTAVAAASHVMFRQAAPNSASLDTFLRQPLVAAPRRVNPTRRSASYWAQVCRIVRASVRQRAMSKAVRPVNGSRTSVGRSSRPRVYFQSAQTGARRQQWT